MIRALGLACMDIGLGWFGWAARGFMEMDRCLDEEGAISPNGFCELSDAS